MEAKELRIGNYAKGGDIGIIRTVGNTCAFKTKTTTVRIYTEDLEAIPLTEEWKDKIKDNEYLLIDKSGFIIFKNGYAYQFVFKDYPFLHQLQNLYFALTGKELTISK